ncbi:MAG: class I SAM-dependent methyltransferase [Terracidiphilus sp.]
MTEGIQGFYEGLADHYHLIFEDWQSAIDRQATVLSSLLRAELPAHPLRILDCACGIDTQSIGFAAIGHQVVATDLSPKAVDRAQSEAQRRSLEISFLVSDMTSLREVPESGFDVVAAIDNALPHLSPIQLRQAVSAMASKLTPNGVFIATIRDYDKIILRKPASHPPAFYGSQENRRIVHQIWDWIGDDKYILHLYITAQTGQGWETHHFVSEYRCLLRRELTSVLVDSGFADVRWLMPAESGFYQPLVLARRSSHRG